MCGIFGAIGANFNRGIVRALALINRERGEESLGFFDSNGLIVKAAGDPLDILPDCADYIDKADRWFIAGHTRYATFGARTNKNAHPFRFGRIVGAHNGCVDVPTGSKYKVDSQYLFDMLNRHGGDYQAALADISGYWGLAWFDGEAFWLQAHSNSVSIGKAADGAWYYSSDVKHLAAAAGKLDNVLTLAQGQTIRFTSAKPDYDIMPVFVSKAPPRQFKRWNYSTPAPAAALVGFQGAKQPAADVPGAGKKRKVNPATGAPIGDKRPTAAWLEERILKELDLDDIDIADDFAVQLGYGGLVDFMQTEGRVDVEAAVRYLEDNINVVWHDADDKDEHADEDDYERGYVPAYANDDFDAWVAGKDDNGRGIDPRLSY